MEERKDENKKQPDSLTIPNTIVDLAKELAIVIHEADEKQIQK